MKAQVHKATAESITEAARLIRAGELVAFPTETVYGLGADARKDAAVARIFAAKRRPRFNPLIVHVPDLGAAVALGHIPEIGQHLAARFWPGGLSLVVRRKADAPVSLLCSAGLDTIALRVPSHPVALRLLDAAGAPIAAPSANASGEVSPTTAQHVAESLGDAVSFILDGGPCTTGLESTVIGLAGERPSLLRAGAISRQAIEAITGPLAEPLDKSEAPESPGRLLAHYAPRHPLRLNAWAIEPEEGLIAFGADVPSGGRVTLNLSPSGDLTEAAANLFAYLRAMDKEAISGIAVVPLPETGLGEAINDRLRRAAYGARRGA
ncbi:MAG: threonylcarbamoyl-AMP synthase [Alphaproteobacteria bacterium]|nr:threonylcarbamoyl-AMP synthase [Alphaproteobacteria bacterium]